MVRSAHECRRRRLDGGADYCAGAGAAQLVTHSRGPDDQAVEQPGRCRSEPVERCFEAPELQAQRCEGAADPLRRNHDHRRAAALRLTRQTQGDARWERRRAGAEVDDDQSESARLEDQFSRLENDDRTVAAQSARWLRHKFARSSIEAHKTRSRRALLAAIAAGAKLRVLSIQALTSPARVATETKWAAIVVRSEPMGPTISLTRPRMMPPSMIASSAASPELSHGGRMVSAQAGKGLRIWIRPCDNSHDRFRFSFAFTPMKHSWSSPRRVGHDAEDCGVITETGVRQKTPYCHRLVGFGRVRVVRMMSPGT